ncbi:MAG: extracellular solute-binding protein [Eubacteriales bacterium]|nr:extracellular solute-binding protein [Eubacteriales bacterium]MDD4476481.1 extracellular solute-binding protein [Eubacteriales bacterium]
MNIKKFGVLLLVVMLLLPFAACGEKNQTESTVSTATDTSSTTSEEKKLFEGLPDVNYGGKEIQFLIGGEEQGVRYFSREILADEESEDIINVAVLERNRIVEEEFGVKIKGYATEAGESLINKIRTSNLSQDDTYDIMAPYMDGAVTLAAEGFFHNLNAIPNMRIDGHFWDQRANDDLEIMGKLYFTTGYISILDNECTQCLIFNKKVAKDYLDGIDLYKLVKDGDWTIDKMVEVARMVTNDTDGVQGMTYKDTWGLYINLSSPTHMFVGAGQRLVKKDGAGNPIITIDSADSARVVSKLADVMGDENASIIIENLTSQASADGFQDVYFLASNQISQDKALLRTMCLIDLWDIADTAQDFDFGILPNPKLDKEQDKYYSNVSTFPVPAYVIPVYAKDKDISALVLSAMCEASEDTLNEAYYNKLLKRRRFTDMDSREMLDIIFEDRVYDLGSVFNWGDIRGVVNDSVSSGSSTFASTWEARKDSVENAMQKTIEAFQLLAD